MEKERKEERLQMAIRKCNMVSKSKKKKTENFRRELENETNQFEPDIERIFDPITTQPK